MSEMLAIRDKVRDFLRKYDEITTPIIRFIGALIMYISINSLFGYSELFGKGIVIFLLSVISALVSSTVVVLLGGVVILVNVVSVSVEVALLFMVLFIVIYCMYMRMFPDCSWILALVPILYLLKMQYAIPLIVAIFAGYSGMVATVFGVVLYYFSVCTEEVNSLIKSAVDEDKVQPFNYMVDTVLKNETMILTAMVFAIVVAVTYFILRLPIDYAQYAAVGIGGVCNILFFMICSAALDVSNVGLGSLLLGTIIGVLVAYAAQLCKGLVDYSRKETVQFEDDDYYYYVKAVPKFNVPAKNKNVKKMTGEAVERNQEQQPVTAESVYDRIKPNSRNNMDRNISANPNTRQVRNNTNTNNAARQPRNNVNRNNMNGQNRNI